MILASPHSALALVFLLCSAFLCGFWCCVLYVCYSVIKSSQPTVVVQPDMVCGWVWVFVVGVYCFMYKGKLENISGIGQVKGWFSLLIFAIL